MRGVTHAATHVVKPAVSLGNQAANEIIYLQVNIQKALHVLPKDTYLGVRKSAGDSWVSQDFFREKRKHLV